VQSAEIQRTALVVDVREGSKLEKLPAIVKSVRRMIPTMVIYLEATEASLIRRYSETRRPHPLGADSPMRASLTAERRRLKPIRAIADWVVDTSKFNVHELRAHLTERFQKKSSDKNILVSCVSFGFKHGVPEDADLVFDVRFLPNPHFVPEFRPLTGRDPLCPRRQELPDHQLRLHRRPAPQRHDRRRRKQAPARSRLPREGAPQRQPEVGKRSLVWSR
jgi:UPF0042 nucleotide-binding protein